MAYDFDTIARDYDRMNHLMTLGLDRRWRRCAVRGLRGKVLDVACGTGDMVCELQKQGCSVVGIDLSEEMLSIARQKAPAATCLIADAEQLPFEDGAFDAVTCAFGVRNFVHLKKGLGEMLRVLKPGGRMVILELATPDSVIIRPFYDFYAKHTIPLLGKWLAGNRTAYTYLPESIERFPKGEDFMQIIKELGAAVVQHKQTFGVCRMYQITKP